MKKNYDAKTVAIDFIKPYVIRGDSLESLMSGQGGEYCKTYEVQIGGYIWNKAITKMVYKAKRDEVVVSELDGKECLYVFKIHKLYDEIRSGQVSLFQACNL